MISATNHSLLPNHNPFTGNTFRNINNYDLDDSEISLSIQQELKDFENLLESFDLNQMGAPFLPNTLQVARKQLYTKIKSITASISSERSHALIHRTMNKVDTQVFDAFIEKIKPIYRDLVWKKQYKLPPSVKLFDLKEAATIQEYQLLCYAIADWLVQVEISADLIARAELYGIHTPKNKLNLSDIEQKYFIEKGTLGKITQNVTNSMINNTNTLLSSVLTPSKQSSEKSKWTALTSLAGFILGSEKLSWTLFASGTSIAYAIGGYLVSQILNAAKRQVTEKQINEEISNLKRMTHKMIEFLSGSNQELQKAIDACLKLSERKNREKESFEVSSKINLLLEYLSSGKIVEECHLLVGESVLMTKESQDGWIVCDLEVLEEKNGEEDFVVFAFGQ